jgi:hypothetical protein
MTHAQISNRLPLTREREEGEAPGTMIFHFSGPFTARTVFECQSPDAVNKMFDLQLMLPTGEPPSANIFDLTDVPCMILRAWAWSSGNLGTWRRLRDN